MTANSSRRILVFGGTFDPPHLAHARLPAQAAAQLQCHEIVYVPAAINPLKTDYPNVDNEHRLTMLLLAIADVPNARISTIELDRPGPSYTIDTLRALRAEYSNAPQSQRRAAMTAVTRPPRVAAARLSKDKSDLDAPAPPEFRLLIGCDQALDFHRWKDWQQILTLATPAVMVRPPWNQESFHQALREAFSKVEAESWFNWTLRLPLMDISATEVRQRLRAGDDDSLREVLDPAVLDFIRRNNLYVA